MMGNVLIIQNSPVEGPELIETVLRATGHGITILNIFEDQPLPKDAMQFDALVVMGGPMGVSDTTRYPFITDV